MDEVSSEVVACPPVPRRVVYALVGGLLGLGAPLGLLFVRLMRRPVSVRLVVREMRNDLGTYIYTGTSTIIAFTIFGGVLGRYADRLARLATTDSLTGLLNARTFHDRLHEELTRAARYREPLSLLMIDLDGLKRVNDLYGHEAGDAALRSVAAAIRSGLREIDLGARLGGDEFGVLAPRTNEDSAIVLGERLRTLVAEGGDGTIGSGTSISVGITSLVPSRDQNTSTFSLMRTADEALYRAKRLGGNRVAGRPSAEWSSRSPAPC